MPPEEDNTLVGYKSLVHPDSCLVPLSHSHHQASFTMMHCVFLTCEPEKKTLPLVASPIFGCSDEKSS